jgi:lipopolysaccharide export system protein LptC
MPKRNIIYSLLIILSLLIYYYFSTQNNKIDTIEFDISKAPTYQSDAMLTTVYDPSGEIIYKIQASQVAYFAEKGESYFSMPDIILYDRQESATWHLQANRAYLTKDRMLSLDGGVQLINLTPHSHLERIETKSAKINLINQVITSPETVTIKGPDFYSTGEKLNGNLKEKTANLLQNVKTFYR